MPTLFSFEWRRALNSSFSLVALLALAVSAGLMAALVAVGQRIGPQSDAWAPTTALVGALWAAAAGVTVNERNRQTLVEDIWWWLEPRQRLQSVLIFLPWLAAAFLQGALVACAIGFWVGAGDDAVTNYVTGFAAGVPAGLMLSALSRVTAGASFVMGVTLLAALLFMKPLSQLAGAVGLSSASAQTAALGLYVVIALALWFAISGRTGR